MNASLIEDVWGAVQERISAHFIDHYLDRVKSKIAELTDEEERETVVTAIERRRPSSRPRPVATCYVWWSGRSFALSLRGPRDANS